MRVRPGGARDNLEPTNHQDQQDTCTVPEEKPHDWAGRVRVKSASAKSQWVQRGACREKTLDPLTRLGRLRARSGYKWAPAPPGFLNKWSPRWGTGPPPWEFRGPFLHHRFLYEFLMFSWSNFGVFSHDFPDPFSCLSRYLFWVVIFLHVLHSFDVLPFRRTLGDTYSTAGIQWFARF